MIGGATPDDQLDELEEQIDRWMRAEADTNPIVAAVERGDPNERRWYLRLVGEQKSTFTIWFTLRQRALHHETYVLPAPEENEAAFYEHLLRRNDRLRRVAFSIGIEDGVFLRGEIDNDHVDDAELDRIVGTVYAAVEQCFVPALRIGFASRLTR